MSGVFCVVFSVVCFHSFFFYAQIEYAHKESHLLLVLSAAVDLQSKCTPECATHYKSVILVGHESVVTFS